MERLLSVWNDQDDPELSAIDNQRRRHVRIQWAFATFSRAIGSDELPELGLHIANLAVALGRFPASGSSDDLIEGVTDPLFVAERQSSRDSKRIWGARLQASLAVECLILSGLSREKAASHAARHHPALARLKRGTSRDLKGSLLSWYDYFIEGRVPVPALLEEFAAMRRRLKAAQLSPAEYRRRGEQALAKAAQSATR